MAKRITIGVDGNEANVEKKVGVSVYALNLLHYFASHARDDLRFIIYLKHTPQAWMPKASDYFQYAVIPGPILWSQIFLPISLYLNRIANIFFSPAHYIPRYCPIPTVVTIHDVSYLYYPEEFLKNDLYKLTHWTAAAVARSKQIIAVSKTTKKDLLKHYQIEEDKVSVIYNGFTKLNAENPDRNPIEAYNLKNNKYILYVGTLQPRKNINILIRAFKNVQEKHSSLKLVIVGKKGWMWKTIFEEVEDLQLTESIIFTGYIPDAEVAELYKHALVFVLPSLYEGFGIPILEAMSQRCPVIASYRSSLPEIAGEACLYFDPADPEALATKIESIIQDPQLRNDLIQKGIERSENFSWDICGQQTLDVILNTVKSL